VLRDQKHLKLAAYWLCQQDKVARVVTPAQVLLDTMRAVRAKRDADAAYKNPVTADYPVINDKDWPKTIESIVEFLGTFLGETNKIPLVYVIRETVGLPEGDDPSDRYAGRAEEMIRRAPHDSEVFESDQNKVWEIISKTTKEADCWTYVKPAQRTQDGRAAFRMLYDHYLGANNVNNMASEAEFTQANGHYQGEKKRWSFEKLVRQQVDQHSILKGLKYHGHCGIDPGSEVRYLLGAIKTSALDPVKTQILANSELGTDFHRCIILFKDFIKQSATSQIALDANISKTLEHLLKWS